MAEHVVIVGAGPYGLSVAAHLRAAGIEPRVFGDPMSYWRDQMPLGMWLRSSWAAASIGSPDGSLSIAEYERATGQTLERPVRLDDFVAYGNWFAEQAAPDLDARYVSGIRRRGSGFGLDLENGEEVEAERVVMATGLYGWGHRPSEFDELPDGVVLHASEMRDPRDLAGRRVAVIGGGQSAIECAALLHEAGADVEVLVRAPYVHFLTRAAAIRRWTGPLKRLLYAANDVGPPGVSWVVAKPELLRRLSPTWQAWMCARSLRPAASSWLVPRTADVPIRLRQAVTAVEVDNGNVELQLDGGGARVVDTVVLGTGYRFDITHHPLLAPDIVAALDLLDGSPRLGPGFESSVTGLHFVGAMATPSFGPVMRFVSGSWYTGPAVARHLAHGR